MSHPRLRKTRKIPLKTPITHAAIVDGTTTLATCWGRLIVPIRRMHLPLIQFANIIFLTKSIFFNLMGQKSGVGGHWSEPTVGGSGSGIVKKDSPTHNYQLRAISDPSICPRLLSSNPSLLYVENNYYNKYTFFACRNQLKVRFNPLYLTSKYCRKYCRSILNNNREN